MAVLPPDINDLLRFRKFEATPRWCPSSKIKVLWGSLLRPKLPEKQKGPFFSDF